MSKETLVKLGHIKGISEEAIDQILEKRKEIVQSFETYLEKVVDIFDDFDKNHENVINFLFIHFMLPYFVSLY